ncbi:MAG: DUF5996 family protein [Solirubrobacteraceae bacterium]|nr:DUF5996 family protein [Solirubrobacteraceae bacterium]
MTDAVSAHDAWPALRVEDWAATRDTLHLWSQVVGKVKMAKAPMLNHWWHVTFVVSPRGLTTGAIPDGDRVFEMEFDFVDHLLRVTVQGGEERTVSLEPKSVATFHAETMAALAALGIDVSIWPVPVEVVVAIPFEDDTAGREYDAASASAFWRQLVQATRVLAIFRGRFAGKVSPVHVFWGALDLAVTRFSGRPAPKHPGGAPNCADWVMVEGYSHELTSCGFWPGGGEEGAFYAYAYPEPEGYREQPVRPEAAYYNQDAGQYLLPYEAVRTAADPDAALLDFLQDTYDAAARLGDWDASLDYVPIEPH